MPSIGFQQLEQAHTYHPQCPSIDSIPPLKINTSPILHESKTNVHTLRPPDPSLAVLTETEILHAQPIASLARDSGSCIPHIKID